MDERAGNAEAVQAGQTAAGVDLPPELCAEIQEFARVLPDLDYYGVLGVERDADANQIRGAFFERSKLYHPDRYFTRNLGPFQPLLVEIYKRIVVANDVLRDPKLRRSYDDTLSPAPANAPSAPRPAETTSEPLQERVAPPPPAPQRKARSGSSLRERKGLQSRRTILGGLERQLESGRRKARRHAQEARQQMHAGDWVRAASLARLAVAYDPREKAHHDALAEVLPRANAEQAAAARRRGEMLLVRGQTEAAIESLVEAARLSPTDAALSMRVAELIVETEGDLDQAIEFGRQAVELDEKNAEYRKKLGMIYRTAGSLTQARRELQRAWELDPMDREVKAALSGM
jgi:tetratricopeptide (TPR) repeat protein